MSDERASRAGNKGKPLHTTLSLLRLASHLPSTRHDFPTRYGTSPTLPSSIPSCFSIPRRSPFPHHPHQHSRRTPLSRLSFSAKRRHAVRRAASVVRLPRAVVPVGLSGVLDGTREGGQVRDELARGLRAPPRSVAEQQQRRRGGTGGGTAGRRRGLAGAVQALECELWFAFSSLPCEDLETLTNWLSSSTCDQKSLPQSLPNRR
jgi:hypothetical protein